MVDDLMTQETQNSQHKEIALRAHRLWEERGCPTGSSEGDWFRATEEIRGEQAVRDEVVRARNRAVRVHHKPEAEGAPPFSDHSGSL